MFENEEEKLQSDRVTESQSHKVKIN